MSKQVQKTCQSWLLTLWLLTFWLLTEYLSVFLIRSSGFVHFQVDLMGFWSLNTALRAFRGRGVQAGRRVAAGALLRAHRAERHDVPLPPALAALPPRSRRALVPAVTVQLQ